jgi:antirestriction protein ArdC
VVKGERAIRIWAPCPPSRKAVERWQRDGADDERPRMRWRLAAVFAQDQVQPLPPPATPAPLEPPIRDIEGDELAYTLPELTALAGELSCTVDFESLTPPVHGYYEPGSKRIVVSQSLSANGMVKTLCHEIAHALVRLDRRDDDPELDYAQEELVAESVAYTCVGTLGISSEEYSIPYLASWAEATSLDVLEQTAKLTDRLAARIEAALHAATEDTDGERSDSDERTGETESGTTAGAHS